MDSTESRCFYDNKRLLEKHKGAVYGRLHAQTLDMRRGSAVIFLILLMYLTVLNFFIANVLYIKYFQKQGSLKLLSPPAQANHSLVGALRLRERPDEHAPTCNRVQPVDVAVVMAKSNVSVSNDHRQSRGVEFLTRLRMLLVRSETQRYRVWLVLRAEDFLTIYRLWCAALSIDTRDRCSCEITFARQEMHVAAATHVLTQNPCVQDLFLIDSQVSFPASMFTRSDTVGSGMVVCLLPVIPDKRCAGMALYVPHVFLARCVARVCQQRTHAHLLDAQIPELAARTGVFSRGLV